MNNIQVSYPQGSGGVWISSVLHYCAVLDLKWVPQKINFHGHSERKINNFHHADVADNVLSIGNGNYKYNFWKLYTYKRILHELTYKRVRGMRVVVAPYDNYVDEKDDFFWLVNQCRFIQSYQCDGKFQIDWQNLFYNPEKSWNTICEFLEHNQIENCRTIDQFLVILENYKTTCRQINFNINFKHKLFKIWALAFLQNNNYVASFDIFENFEKAITDNWISTHKDLILDYTNTNCIKIN
jgi:hypothetical protein